jgi:DNA-binding LacI/PurR family transcriptional regulator
LLRKNRHDCWLLMRSTESLQRWFMERGIPSLIAGSAYPGILLPSVGDDHRSICRHAANRLIALGHRRIAFLNRRPSGAPDRESDAGFAEAVRAAPAKVEARTVYHNSSHKNAVQLIERLFAASAPPTGLLIVNSYCYLSVLSALARLGRRVPGDVSLISKDDDAFLAYMDPEPARYAIAPGALVHKSMVFLRSMLEGASIKPISVRLIPNFIAGASCRRVGTAVSRAEENIARARQAGSKNGPPEMRSAGGPSL